ncbi:sialate O-acetylesterase [Nocardioides sp. TF02-7]|uniref:sialate O-acetylesterase n=1 Tax=Nocardioides sp. TF02-7 TaxID=2917724 RepID=UPI001F064D34|nr:sialate O-acetylesterase [Nocardioides sp. TF02-7]UMG94647.1 sialate O-acetylesterase [Nocardioides sp. TF02-7]
MQGQSNAQAAPLTSHGSTVAESPFIRSYGTNHFDAGISGADRAWSFGGGDLHYDSGAVGQWPLQMANDLIRTEQVPIAVVNGAHGGQPIAFFQRDDADPGDIATNYGRTLQRLDAAGLTDDLSGVLWYQGEADEENAAVHVDGFRALLADWRDDLGGARGEDPPYYVFQVRTTGCGSVAGVALREAQRRLGHTDDVTVLSTTATPGHDGCHFSWPGYRVLGNQVADTLRRDLFGGPSEGVAAPDPVSARFTPGHDTVVVQLASTDELTVDPGVAADFRLVGSTATVTDVAYADGGRLEVTLSRPAPEATGLSYHGRIGDGPFITTSRDVGLLAFGSLPIAAPTSITATSVRVAYGKAATVSVEATPGIGLRPGRGARGWDRARLRRPGGRHGVDRPAREVAEARPAPADGPLRRRRRARRRRRRGHRGGREGALADRGEGPAEGGSGGPPPAGRQGRGARGRPGRGPGRRPGGREGALPGGARRQGDAAAAARPTDRDRPGPVRRGAR